MRLDDILHRVQRPARYAGGEWNSVVKDWDTAEVRVALCLPDFYEAGSGHAGMALLYDCVNKHPGLLAERAFSPWLDLEEALRHTGTPLFSLETRHALGEFDLWHISLDSELAYSNLLTLLDLAGVPLSAGQRDHPLPLIVAGGRCARNLEPLADVLDAVLLGEGEASLLDVCHLVRTVKKEWEARGRQPGRAERLDLLRRLAALEGVYVPSLYRPFYAGDGGPLVRLETIDPGAPENIHARLSHAMPLIPTRTVVPFLPTADDRAWVELGRERVQVCRACGGGPLPALSRMRSADEIAAAVEVLISNTGYPEVALAFPGSGDDVDLPTLLRVLRERLRGRVRLTLPDMPVSAVSEELMAALGDGRKGGLTLNVGGSSQRLRGSTGDQDLPRAVATAFRAGYEHVRLAYLLGLPGETIDDVREIVDIAQQALKAGRQHAGLRARLSIEAGIFIPRAHAVWERAAFVTQEDLAPRLELLKQGLRGKHLKFSHRGYHEALLEAILARGDRRLGPALRRAWELGARFDARPEQFDWAVWQQAFQETGIDPFRYVFRERPPAEVLPWDHLHTGVNPKDLPSEQAVCATCGLTHRLDRFSGFTTLPSHPAQFSTRAQSAPLPLS